MFGSEPARALRELADVPDERLVADLRSAMVAVGYWFDAWWFATSRDASPVQARRAEAVEAVRQRVAMLGREATVELLAEATHPLLGEFCETEQLRAAVDLVRDVTMHRWPLIKYSRQTVAQWDAAHLNVVDQDRRA